MLCCAVLCRWDEAAADYQAVLAVAPQDPVPWNNLGNTYMGEYSSSVPGACCRVAVCSRRHAAVCAVVCWCPAQLVVQSAQNSTLCSNPLNNRKYRLNATKNTVSAQCSFEIYLQTCTAFAALPGHFIEALPLWVLTNSMFNIILPSFLPSASTCRHAALV